MYSRINGSGRPSARKIPVRAINNSKEEKEMPGSSSDSEEPTVNEEVRDEVTMPEETSETDWKSKALRLQADMDNFRKRQMRRADDAIAAERERLLQLVLPVADNLARALNHSDQDDHSLHQGVELIHRELMRILQTEGVTRLETVGQPFTPDLHEAIATMPSAEAESGIITEEIEPGYKLGDKLLRPARVVVAA